MSLTKVFYTEIFQIYIIITFERFMHIGSELLTHKLHIATLGEGDQKVYLSVHLPLSISLALKF